MVILIALFLEPDNTDDALKTIKSKFQIQNNKIFVLEQMEDPDERIFTFNIEIDEERKEDLNLDEFGKLIRIHRKKETNTLYTINALNSIMENSQNIDWNRYKYCFLTVSAGVLKIIKTKLYEIIDLDKID
jgi:hypothetical protein